MKIKLGIILIAGFLFSNSEAFSRDPNFQIYLCIGQSNMEGAACAELQDSTVNADQGGICAGFNEIIVTLPRTLPNSYAISSAGCTDKQDNLHFNAEGYRKFGKRYAVQILSILGYPIIKKE